jgi:AMP-polyphosphate phosphotransferase
MLEDLDLEHRMEPTEYREAFPRLKDALRRLQYELRDAEIATVVLFEGWGASGKGDVFQKLTEGLDPRIFRAYPETPPSELERRYHWLWRYQVRLPEDGLMTLFDHAWYRRVLGERVDRTVRKKACRQAYDQINEFERWLTDDGQIVVKLFFHIPKDEQRRRLRQMQKEPLEQWKVDDDDWEQNRRYGRWVKAVEDMLIHTDTRNCPWTLVPATDVRWARVLAFEALVKRMSDALARRRRAPADVSRTRLAASALRSQREQRAGEALSRARSTAEEAGLPLDAEAPPPVVEDKKAVP